MTYRIVHGDSRLELKNLEDNSIDAIVCDPPYGLKFMGKKWDYDVPDVELWAECLRVLKPGGHLLSFGGSRTFHRIAVAIEDAGFEIRDSIIWHYATGFPKSHNISKAIDKKFGAEREVVGVSNNGAGNGSVVGLGSKPAMNKQYEITAPATVEPQQWHGWGTALKPSHEPIIMARKPIEGTVAENVLKHGTGGINIDACRIGDSGGCQYDGPSVAGELVNSLSGAFNGVRSTQVDSLGRWPANTIFDEYVAEMIGDKAKFFMVAKASKRERTIGLEDLTPTKTSDGRKTVNNTPYLRDDTPRQNNHPTVKPVELMRYLVRLVTPPNGIVLDPFTGSGSTGVAALLEGYQFIGIEREAEYVEIAETRLCNAKACTASSSLQMNRLKNTESEACTQTYKETVSA